MDGDSLTYEVVYLDENKQLNDEDIVVIENSTNKEKFDSTTSNTYVDLSDEGNLIKRLMNGELTFSEYNKEMDKKNISDDDDDENMIDDVIENTADEILAQKYNSRSNASKNFEAELHKTRKDAMRGILKGRARMRDGRQRRRCVLPAALQGLMGEANLRYARGQNDLAEKVCLEIIRQVPLAPEPFLTLAQIHDSNPEKYLQFSLIAAHLNPADSEQWIRIAQFCIEQNDIKRAINCYTKAIKFNPKDIDLRLKRIEMLESIEDEKMAFRCWYSLVFIIPSEQGLFLLRTAKMVTERFIKSKQYAKALEVMSYAYRKVPELFQNEDLNQFFELLTYNNEFKQIIDILCLHTDLQVTYNKNQCHTMIREVKIPKLMILDFRSKLIVSLIHLKAFHLIECLIENIFAHINVADAGDCYLDVAEALMKMERYSDAIRLLEPLLQSKNYSLAAVWLRHADCYRAIGDHEKAILSYSQVVTIL